MGPTDVWRNPRLNPPPTAAYALPFHRAIDAAGTAPAVVNAPPIQSCGPVPSSYERRPATEALTPAPSADHDVPFHFAMRLAATPPAEVNPPPAWSASPVPES